MLSTRALVRNIPTLTLIFTLFLPGFALASPQEVTIIVEDPQLHPAFTTCPQSYWYPFTNNRGHTAYLTLNTNDPTHSTNSGEWRPLIPQAGYYRVEAYIAGHAPITWCNDHGWQIQHDTTDAHYTIHHVYGASTRLVSQYSLGNRWLNLGEYYFNAGSDGYVSLIDLNAEQEYTTTVSFSAMRFTYTRPTRPIVYLPLIQYNDPSGRPPPDAGVIQAQGFDACHLPTIAEMQTWWDHSPYDIYALYLGGIQLPALCAVADAAWVSAVHQQGWSFIPTWVGPQAPCSPYTHKMNADPAVSYREGRQEAEAASVKAHSLGLTNYGWGGTVIYYDMEVFGGANLQCRQAASAFMTGWVDRLEELGNVAGGYGAHNSYIEDWAALDNVPDVVWAASWYTDTYDPDASVLSIPWLNGLWIDHQRIRQYAGDHSERWGTIQLGIDSDVADGVVAMPPGKPLAKPILSQSPSIEDAGWLSVDQGWLVSGNHLYWTDDRGKTWVNLSSGSIQIANFLHSGQAWALSVPDQSGLNLYHSSDWGQTWRSQSFSLPSNDWWPLQLQFSSPLDGWIVLQKQASQALSSGILMKTSDGGLTWQSSDLPTAGKISFTSPTEGWLLNSSLNALFHTSDSGLTWQPEGAGAYVDSQPDVPEGTLLSGWKDGSLGWSVTMSGSCNGDKFVTGFSCQVTTSLWQTVNTGRDWEIIPTPDENTARQ